MSDPAFFGYGSLVNLATHDYADPQPATLPGWHRVWHMTDTRDAAFLSASPGGDGIDGIIAKVPGADWDALDRREGAYQRIDVTDALAAQQPTAIYSVAPHLAVTPDPEHGILLSYLDVVVQGFLKVFGEDGVTRFFDTTRGWDMPIIDDRTTPRYPRAQRLSAAERDLVDRSLARVQR